MNYKYQVFISFTSKDKPLKDKLVEFFNKELGYFKYKGIDLCFWDMDSSCVGLWNDKCREGLYASRAVLCLLSDNVGENSVVHDEMALAAKLCKEGKLEFIPVILTDTPDKISKLPLIDYTNIFSYPVNGETALSEAAFSELRIKLQALLERELGKPQGVTDIKDYFIKPFVGRERELNQIKEAFASGIKTVVLQGIGGIGKTELARRFALLNRDAYPNTYIIEVSSDGDVTDSKKERHIKDLITQIRFVGTPNDDLDAAYRANLGYLKNLPPTTVIIFDGYDVNLDTVKEIELLVSGFSCEFIITSRQSSQIIKTITVDVLEQKEAERLFVEYCPKRKVGGADIAELVQNVERHTLTVELMAKLLNTSKLLSVEQVKKSVFDVQASCKLERLQSVDTAYSHVSNIFKLSALSPFKAEVMSVLCRICSRGIAASELYPLISVTEETEYQLAELSEAGFVRNLNDIYSLHSIVSEVAFRSLTLDVNRDIAVTDWLREKALSFEKDAPIIEKINKPEYGIHYLSCRIRKDQDDQYKVCLAFLYFKTAYLLEHLAVYSAALAYYKEVLIISEKVLGFEHQATAECYNSIGNVYDAIDDFKQALEYHQKALAINEKVFGYEHTDTAGSYNNIGLIYDSLGDYKQALEYYRKALTIFEKALGVEHPDTASCYGNIGLVYCNLGNYKNALEYYQKALTIFEKVLGVEHPDTAMSYNNVGSAYYGTGDYNQALKYFQNALTKNEKALGVEHPDTATSYNNIGNVYYCTGDYKQAMEYYQKALTIYEKVLGVEHLATANSYNNIGLLYNRLGDYKQALEYYQKALTIREKTLGVEHLATATSYYNIGNTYFGIGDYKLALEYHQKALTIYEKVFGVEHPKTAASYNNIGYTYEKLGEYPKALEYYQKSFAIFEKTLGAEHPDTVRSKNNIKSVKEKLSGNN